MKRTPSATSWIRFRLGEFFLTEKPYLLLSACVINPLIQLLIEVLSFLRAKKSYKGEKTLCVHVPLCLGIILRFDLIYNHNHLKHLIFVPKNADLIMAMTVCLQSVDHAAIIELTMFDTLL